VKDKQLQLFLSKFILSFGGVGFAPKAPGTFGSIASIPLVYWILKQNFNIYYLVVAYSVLTIFACCLAQWVQKKENSKDPQWIVLDEVIGMLFGSLFIGFSIPGIMLLLVIFRFFDIIKFWPATYFDRMDHGLGTIVDDVISGFYTGFLLLIINYFYPLQ
jgi:phosphatidylglycerophosphatase A